MVHHTQRLFLVSLLCFLGLSAAQAQAPRYTLQVEALDSLNPALKLVQRLKASGTDAYYVKSEVPGKGVYYRVRVGNFPDKASAQRRGLQLCRTGLIRTYYVTLHEGTGVAFPDNIPPSHQPRHAPAPPPKAAAVAHPVRPKQVRVIRRSAVVTCQGKASVVRRCASARPVSPRRATAHRPHHIKPKPAYVRCCGK